MIRIFGDKIDDQIFPKNIKRFTAEEKDLITKFVNSILREDKNSELESSSNESLYDQLSNITDSLNFLFILNKKKLFSLTFAKFYKNDIKEKHCVYYRNFMLDGKDDGYTIQDTKTFANEISKEKVLTGVYVWCRRGKLPAQINDSVKDRIENGAISIYLRDFLIGEQAGESDFVMRTRYEQVENGGSILTSKCKERIKNLHFDKIFKIIQKEVQKD
jgi:hypothetical protein